MTLTSRLIGEENREAFDGYMARGPKGHILQSYAWGKVKAHTGWQPLRLMLEEDGRVVGAISILKRKIPLMGKCIFYAPRGPVVNFKDRRVLKALFDEVHELARRHRSILLKIDPDLPVSDQEALQNFREIGFRKAKNETGFEGVQPKFVFRLDLTPEPEALMASFHSKTRYNIRLAQKKGVRIIQDCTQKDLRIFYDVLLETAQRDRFLVRNYDYFTVIWNEMVTKGLAKLFLAEYQGKIIAGTLAFLFGDKSWYIYGASSNKYRNVMPNYLLQWTMIRWARESGCKMYDFRGVPGNLSEDNPLYGLYRFKKGFKGTYVEFMDEMDLVYDPAYYWFWNTCKPAISQGLKMVVGLKKKFWNREGS